MGMFVCDGLLFCGEEQQIANSKKTAYVDFAANSDLLTSEIIFRKAA